MFGQGGMDGDDKEASPFFICFFFPLYRFRLFLTASYTQSSNVFPSLEIFSVIFSSIVWSFSRLHLRLFWRIHRWSQLRDAGVLSEDSIFFPIYIPYTLALNTTVWENETNL
jgi:hypothetical protein